MTKSDADPRIDWERVKAPKSVFISGTYDDMSAYRPEAAKGISDAGHRPLEPQGVPRLHERTIGFVRRQLENMAEFYVGVFGLRYGSRIDGHPDEISYTHYEYRLAIKRWAQHHPPPPPMKVFAPEPGSVAYRELEHAARLRDEALSPTERDRDRADQVAFIQEVLGKETYAPWAGEEDEPDPLLDRRTRDRIIDTFSSREHLRDRVTIDLLNWQILMDRRVGDQLARIAARRPEVPSHAEVSIPKAVAALFSRVGNAPLPPAMCVVIQGRRRETPHLVAAAIRARNPWEVEEPDHHIDLTSERARGLTLLWDAVFDAAEGAVMEDAERVDATRIAEMVEDNEIPIMLGISGLQRLPVADFATKFWLPLHQALVARHRQREGQEPFPSLLVIASFQGTMKPEMLACFHPAAPDTKLNYAKPILVSTSSSAADTPQTGVTPRQSIEARKPK